MILELVMLAALPVLWDIGRRFASRPNQEQDLRLTEALFKIHQLEKAHKEQALVIAGHRVALDQHTDKLNVKALQTQPISREPRIKR